MHRHIARDQDVPTTGQRFRTSYQERYGVRAESTRHSRLWSAVPSVPDTRVESRVRMQWVDQGVPHRSIRCIAARCCIASTTMSASGPQRLAGTWDSGRQLWVDVALLRRSILCGARGESRPEAAARERSRGNVFRLSLDVRLGSRTSCCAAPNAATHGRATSAQGLLYINESVRQIAALFGCHQQRAAGPARLPAARPRWQHAVASRAAGAGQHRGGA